MNKPEKAEDNVLVKKVIEGDKELFGLIVDRYEKPLNRYALRYVRNETGAADVVQEVFIKAYINLRSFKQTKKFSSWIYRITHNEAISYMRKHKKEVTTSDEDWFDNLADDRTAIEDIIDREIEAQKIKKLLMHLKDKYREPLLLFAIDNKSYEEISEILHLPINTIGTRINRAKSQLRDILDKENKR